jgi:hypothetical protein
VDNRKLLTDRGGELGAKLRLLIGSASPHTGVGDTFACGVFDCGRFRQNALPLIATASHAPTHHDGRQSAGLTGAPGECGVAGRQKLEVTEVGAVKTHRTGLVHA